MQVKTFLILYLINLTIWTVQCGTINSLNGRKVVLMSMDGFRYDYLTKTHTPNFDALIASGVKVPYVNNTFATWTFPCHYTIVTGLYEESHGIIANAMYDPLLNETFNKGSKESRWWDGGEPIWINAVKSGRKTGVFFWPGSETELEGYRPTKWMPYNISVPFKERVDTVVSEWLAKEDFDFGIIYFHEPDRTGHVYGPDSPEIIDTIGRMDKILGYFMATLKENNLTGRVDLILLSDHGMTKIVEYTKHIILDNHVNDTLLHEVIVDGAVAHLVPKPGKSKELVSALQNIPNTTVYLKEDIPDHYHYKNHRRVMPVVMVADEGYYIVKSDKELELEKGGHGYSNDVMNMKPIFMAIGPSFKEGVITDPIKSVDVYPLLCHLLDIQPAPNNGSFQRISDMLKIHPGSKATSNVGSIFFTIMFAMLYISFEIKIF